MMMYALLSAGIKEKQNSNNMRKRIRTEKIEQKNNENKIITTEQDHVIKIIEKNQNN